MVHRPFKTRSLTAVLLATAAMPFFASIHSRAQEPPPVAPAQFDPSDVYFQGYLAARSAEQLEANGDFLGATEKLEQARKFFDGVRRYYPDWKKDMVASRAEKTTEAIEAIRPKADEQRRKNEGAVAELEGGNRAAVSEPAADPTPGILDGDPLLNRQLEQAAREVERLRRQIANSAPTEASRNASRVADVERQRDDLATRLRAAETNVERLRARLTTSPAENEYRALNKRIEELEMDREAMGRALSQSRASEMEARTRIATLEADLTNMRKESAELRQKLADNDRNLKKERSIANDVVAGQRRQLDALEKQLKSKDNELRQANQRIAGLELKLQQSDAAFRDLRTEHETLLQERDQMAAILKLSEGGRINQLIEQNMGLAKQLREATEKVERLNLDNNKTKDDWTESLRDLAMAKDQINAFRRERQEQTRRIDELEKRLKNEEGALARGEASADPAEIETLREIIKRQLRVQERRRQARDILVDAAKELGTKDENLAQAIELFDGEEIQLTPEEQRLIADRKVDGEFISPFARDRATVGRATANLNSELASFDRAATRAFSAERFHPAKELFQMMVDSNPGDTSTLCKLGVVELKLSDPHAASDAFRRAMELDSNNPYAHRMLGFCLATTGDISGAEEHVARSVDLAPDDAKGQTLLGVILNSRGRTSEAESHFKAAISADPMLTEPYINLALLCARSKRLDDARNYYQQALERGAAPDPGLEKLLASR